MGMGDWIIATAQVKQLHEKHRRPILVVNRGGVPQWSEVFENNPRIARERTRNALPLINAGGVRPYIDRKTSTHWVWKPWNKAPGEIYLSAAEQEFGARHAGRILIEPHTKVEGSNKAWFWERWQQLVDCGGEFVQVGRPGTRVLRGIEFVDTSGFRLACAVLSRSRAFVGTEGGLHHAAAALGVPAVVLFSEFIGADITGYAGHRNLRHAGAMCGSRVPCAGCRASMERITVDEVHRNLLEITCPS